MNENAYLFIIVRLKNSKASPLIGSHILTVLSDDPLAIRPTLSSESWRRQFTHLMCPVRVIRGAIGVRKEGEWEEGSVGGEGGALTTGNHQTAIILQLGLIPYLDCTIIAPACQATIR